MSGLNMNQQQRPAPRHPLYVSIANGTIHQAMSSPSGYEDEHPEDWRAATFAERDQYMAGVDNINGNPQPQALPQFGGEQLHSLATPQSLQMAEETPVEIVQPPTPAAAPAPVHHGFPVSPEPAYSRSAPAEPYNPQAPLQVDVAAFLGTSAPAPTPPAPAPAPAPASAPTSTE